MIINDCSRTPKSTHNEMETKFWLDFKNKIKSFFLRHLYYWILNTFHIFNNYMKKKISYRMGINATERTKLNIIQKVPLAK